MSSLGDAGTSKAGPRPGLLGNGRRTDSQGALLTCSAGPTRGFSGPTRDSELVGRARPRVGFSEACLVILIHVLDSCRSGRSGEDPVKNFN